MQEFLSIARSHTLGVKLMHIPLAQPVDHEPYNIADPRNSIFMVRPDRSRLIPLRYDLPVSTEYWDDDSSAEYTAMFKRIEREGVVLLRN